MTGAASTAGGRYSSRVDTQSRRAWRDTLLLALLGAVLLIGGLGRYPLWDPDEGRHADIARRMADEGRWLVPIIYDEPYYDKPSAFYWIERASFTLLGRSELAARLPSALATLATLVLLHRFAVRRLGRQAAAIAGAVFLTMPEVVMLGRFCNLDASLALWLAIATAALVGWLQSMRRPPWIAYVAMGIGALIKGPIAVVLPLLVGLAAAVPRGEVLARVRSAGLVRGGLVVGAIFLPWLALAAAADPAYIQTFLVEHNLQRYTSPQFDHAEGPFFFGPVLLAVVFPWSLLLPAALAAGSAEGPRRAYERDFAIWAAVVVLFFSLSRAKLATYVLPAMPPIALWIGSRLERLASAKSPPLGWLRFALVTWAIVFVALPIGVAVYAALEHPDLLAASTATLLLPVLVWVGLRAAWRNASRIPLVFAGSNAALFLGFYLLGAPFVSQVASDEGLVRLAERFAPGVPAVGFRIQPASFSFYSDGHVSQADAPEQLPHIDAGSRLLIVTRRKYADQLRGAVPELHEWADNGRHVLYATFPRPDEAGAALDHMRSDSPPC